MSSDPTSPVAEYLRGLHADLSRLTDGEVATSIPAFGQADRRAFGICLATVDGQLYEVGDTRLPFTLQSIAKPFAYGLALAAHGGEAVARKVGVEPAAEAVDASPAGGGPGAGRPANPVVNAGAINLAGLLAGADPAGVATALLDAFARFAGRPLAVDPDVYEAERAHWWRDAEAAAKLRRAGLLDVDPAAALDLYYKQSAVRADCRDLAVMAATLANNGINPQTGTTALPRAVAADVLSLMVACGMYDRSGEWAYHVGMPAIGGATGAMLAVLPGRLGIGVFSPPLDERGNSVRGTAACRSLSKQLGLHLFRAVRGERPAVQRTYLAATVPSNRERSPATRESLNVLGQRARVYELQGTLTFATTEPVVRQVLGHLRDVDYVVLDWSRVSEAEGPSADLLASLAADVAKLGKRVVFAQQDLASPSWSALRTALEAATPSGQQSLAEPRLDDVDLAVEWCENRLLGAAPAGTDATAVAIGQSGLFAGLTADESAGVRQIARETAYAPGQVVIRKGDQDDAVYLLTQGEVSVVIPLPGGRQKRVATFSPGMFFGEMALLETAPRSATILADGEARCASLAKADLAELWGRRPRIKTVMLGNIAVTLSQRLRKANGTIAVLAR